MAFSRISRRGFLKGLGTILGGSTFLSPLIGYANMVQSNQSASIAGKRVRWIVPSKSGGGYDIYSRLIKPYYEKQLGMKILIENVPGAGMIRGSKMLKEAKPDGLTQGILNGPGLLTANITGQSNVPNLVSDFTILGRVTRSEQVWVTSSTSPINTIYDALNKDKLLFAITDVGSLNFMNIAISSYLMGIEKNTEYIAGFAGSREPSLAAIRGEVDLVAFTFESLLDRIEAGDLRPILQISDQQISSHPSLKGVPLLGGDNGIAVERAIRLGKNINEAQEDSTALVRLIGSGRIIAAPKGIKEDLFHYLEEGLYKSLTDPGFIKTCEAANRSLDVARSEEVLSDIMAITKSSNKFIPIIRRAIEKTRS
ncbi:tripartite tricarboxylate transporter substrate-binding protein [Thermodesulfobacteriota bacterium]